MSPFLPVADSAGIEVDEIRLRVVTYPADLKHPSGSAKLVGVYTG